jgi:hypothetical protein
VFKVFGVDNLVAVHAIMLLFALGALGLTYWLIKLHTDRRTAVVVTLMVGWSGTFFRYGFQVRNDMPFLTAVMAFLVGWELVFGNSSEAKSKRFGWAMMAAGMALAVVMRPNWWPFVASVAVASLWSVIRERRGWKKLIIVAMAIVVAGVFVALDPRRVGEKLGPGAYEESMVDLATHRVRDLANVVLTKNVPDFFEPKFVEGVLGTKLLPGVNTVVAAVASVIGIALARRRALWGLWIAASVATMVIVLPLPRYTLAILPLMALAWWLTSSAISRKFAQPWDFAVLSILFWTWFIPNGVEVVKFMLEQRRDVAFDRVDRTLGNVHGLGNIIREHVDRNGIVLVQKKLGRVETYLSDRFVIEPAQAHRFSLVDHPLYVVEPADDDTKSLLGRMNMQPGEVLARSDGREKKWVLRRVEPIAPAANAKGPA